MAEHIERDRLKKAFNEDVINTMQTWDPSLVNLLMIEIDEAPAADVAPVRHGRWIIHQAFEGKRHNCNECIECSECNTWFGHDCYAKTNYCPYCGAKMDLPDQVPAYAD